MEEIEYDALFAATLYEWYRMNARRLPWRSTRDPYRIWLSEIVLQQTQVAQGLSYYEAFVSRYPTVFHLAEAPLDDVLKLWQGLGYYSRARNLHAAAKMLVEQYGGEFPHSASELMRLKGVGVYTAAAIASFAFDEPIAVVDGNVYRFLSRLFAIDVAIDSTQGIRLFGKLAQSLLTPEKASLHNQAMMEFGALQCTPQPDCTLCPFASSCLALSGGRVGALPMKQHKLKIRTRYFHYIYCMFDDDVLLLHHRTQSKDIWQGLYELPLIENDTMLDFASLSSLSEFAAVVPIEQMVYVGESVIQKHQLTHQRLIAKCYYVKIKAKAQSVGADMLAVEREQLDAYAVPKLVEKFLLEGESIKF